MKNWNILTSLFVFISFGVNGQLSETLMFSEKNYDFGQIMESGGPVTHEFSFVNNGADTIQIANVKASCGCTTPAWTKEPIAPGQSGFIQAQYNPKNRPGSFNKSLTVTLNSSSELLRLFIKGYVEPRPKSIEDELPTLLGGLRMKHRAFNFGKIKVTNEPVIKEFDVLNVTDSVIIFSDSIAKPNHINVEFEPQLLRAKQRGKIRLIYNPSELNDLGFRNDNVMLYTSEHEEKSIKSISVYATLEEYFPPMTPEELEMAPKLAIENALYDFGKLENNKKLTTEFVLSNNGKKPLEIRSVKPNCSCISTELVDKTIPVGGNTRLKVSFNTAGRRGNQQKSVAIFSNDPHASTQRVTVKAYISTDSNR